MKLHNIKAKRKYFLDDPFEAILYFSRNFIKDRKKDVRLFFSIKADEDARELKDLMFIRIDDENINCLLTNKSDMNKSVYNSGTFTYFTQTYDMEKNQFVTGRNHMTTSYTDHWKELKGQTNLDSETEQKIIACSTLIFRLYSGDQPVTYAISENDLQRIKKFLGTVPKQACVN